MAPLSNQVLKGYKWSIPVNSSGVLFRHISVLTLMRSKYPAPVSHLTKIHRIDCKNKDLEWE